MVYLERCKGAPSLRVQNNSEAPKRGIAVTLCGMVNDKWQYVSSSGASGGCDQAGR
jgi:hypothetical protein